MKNNNLIQEEIDRARQLWGYDTSKTIFEQFTGNTGVTGNPLMGITMNTCTGGTVPPDGNSYGMQYAVTINGNNPTQSDIGKTVIANSSYLGNVHGTVTGVFPAGIQQGHSTPHAFGVQPCPTTTTGTTTGTTGGPTPPPPPCNKTCQQLVPGFKNKAGNKPCNWLNNRLNDFTNKLATKTPGSCQHKRIECKIGVVQTLLQQNGC
jgi:hypothetical protein